MKSEDLSQNSLISPDREKRREKLQVCREKYSRPGEVPGESLPAGEVMSSLPIREFSPGREKRISPSGELLPAPGELLPARENFSRLGRNSPGSGEVPGGLLPVGRNSPDREFSPGRFLLKFLPIAPVFLSIFLRGCFLDDAVEHVVLSTAVKKAAAQKNG